MMSRLAKVIAATSLGVVVLAGCSSTGDSTGASNSAPASGSVATSPANASLATASFDELKAADAREVIDALEAVPLSQRRSDLRASVKSKELTLTDTSNNSATLTMPADAFYLSVAPYVSQTHSCTYHSLTTCKAELGDKTLHVKLVTDSGATVMDQDVTAANDGFVGLWLPRDITGTLTFDYDGKTASTDISTVDDDDPTCLTTMQLS